MPPAPRAMGSVGGTGGTGERPLGPAAPPPALAGGAAAPGGATQVARRKSGAAVRTPCDMGRCFAAPGNLAKPACRRTPRELVCKRSKANVQAEEVHQLHRQDLPIEPNHPPTCLRARAVFLAVSSRGVDLPRPSADVRSIWTSSVTSLSLACRSRIAPRKRPDEVLERTPGAR